MSTQPGHPSVVGEMSTAEKLWRKQAQHTMH